MTQHVKCGVLPKKQVPGAGTSNYIPQYLWDVITYSCPWYQIYVLYTPRIIMHMISTSFGDDATSHMWSVASEADIKDRDK